MDADAQMIQRLWKPFCCCLGAGRHSANGFLVIFQYSLYLNILALFGESPGIFNIDKICHW